MTDRQDDFDKAAGNLKGAVQILEDHIEMADALLEGYQPYLGAIDAQEERFAALSDKNMQVSTEARQVFEDKQMEMVKKAEGVESLPQEELEALRDMATALGEEADNLFTFSQVIMTSIEVSRLQIGDMRSVVRGHNKAEDIKRNFPKLLEVLRSEDGEGYFKVNKKDLIALLKDSRYDLEDYDHSVDEGSFEAAKQGCERELQKLSDAIDKLAMKYAPDYVVDVNDQPHALQGGRIKSPKSGQ